MKVSIPHVVLGFAFVLAGQTALAAEPASQLAFGKTLYTEKAVPACAVCHTLADAGSTGDVGPVLDDIRPSAQRVLNAMRNGIGQMPSFSGRLSEPEMQAIAQYVAKASGARN
jgi:cytochrome c6